MRVVTRVGGDKCPKPGESKIDTTGAGAWCAPGRGGSFGSGGAWWLRVLVVASGGCGLFVGVGAQEGGGVRGRGCVWGVVLLGGGGFGWGFWWWLVG